MRRARYPTMAAPRRMTAISRIGIASATAEGYLGRGDHPVDRKDVHPRLSRGEKDLLALVGVEGERIEPARAIPGRLLAPAVAEDRGVTGAHKAHVEARQIRR